MPDLLQQLIDSPVTRTVAKRAGVPTPVTLERYEPGRPVIKGAVLLGAAAGSRLAGPVARFLHGIHADIHTPLDEPVRSAAADADLDAAVFNPDAGPEDQSFKALVFDATGITASEQLSQAYAFFHSTIRRVRKSGRVIVLGSPPEACESPVEAVSQRALEGLVRSIGKEVRRGATAQLIYVRPDAEQEIESTLRFFLSPRSAYVSGQVVRIGSPVAQFDGLDWQRPLSGKVALVTGAARGIGAAIAEVLARDGAHVVGLDIPAQADELNGVMRRLEGSALTVDVTDAAGPTQIADHLLEHHGGVDVVIHNAGVTRDKTLGRMTEDQWNTVIAINLTAPHRIDQELFGRDAVRDNGRVVCVSSISGIAGNAGQTNYATSKAGVIGMVQAYAPRLAERGVTINAVAPGFIETQMTAAMPFATREVGRRLNSLSQGGLPLDVAETIAWFASPGSAGVTGNIVRVCGQGWLGA